jgi:Tfp pilus assembly protein PilF
MELVDVLRHSEPPRTQYFVDIPTEYGKLRLDILGDVGVALAQTGMSEGDATAAREMIEEGQKKLKAGDREGGADTLMEVVKRYPYSVEGYGALYEYYREKEERDEAIYYLRQMIALQPGYGLMIILGKELGRAGRYEEALVLQGFLWEERSKAAPNEALQAACDYLVTLGRMGGEKKMLEVAEQAMKEMGNESTLVYQYIYAHILDKQYGKARALLDTVLPGMTDNVPLHARFVEMSKVVDELLK